MSLGARASEDGLAPPLFTGAAGHFVKKLETSTAPRGARRNVSFLIALLISAGTGLGVGIVVLRQSEYLENLGFVARASWAPLWIFIGVQVGVSVLSAAAGYVAYSAEAAAVRAAAILARARSMLGQLACPAAFRW